MMRTPPIRFGVIGCGVIAYWAHLRELRSLPNARLVAAADPDPAARARTARLVSIPVCESAEELVARGDIDAVVISVPTHLHAQVAIAAAQARKHFYLEKPPATSVEDARAVLGAAQVAGATAVVGFNRRFHPVYQQARELLQAGRIGAVRAALTAFSEPSPPASMPEWKRRRATGGGVLLDLASHHVDLLRWFLRDDVGEVDCRLSSVETEEDTACLRLTMAGGVEVESYFSFRAGLADFLEFIGERGTLRVDRHRKALSLRLPRRLGYGVRSSLVFPGTSVAAWWAVRALRPSYEPSYRRALSAFVEAIRGSAQRGATLHDGLRCLETIRAAEESARSAKPVSVASGGL